MVGQEIEDLQAILTGEQNKKLEHIMDMNAEIINMENRAIYAEGIRFGIELMIEIYQMNEKIKRWFKQQTWQGSVDAAL